MPPGDGPARPTEKPGSAAWLTAAQAAARLGVKPSTIYTYVSRGLITSQRGARSSRLSRIDVERLAAKGKRAQVTRSLSLLIESAITKIEPEGHYYRGLPANALALSTSFEQVAELLWGLGPAGSNDWESNAEVAGPPPHDARPISPLDRVKLAVLEAGTRPPSAYDSHPRAAAGLVGGLVDALPLLTAAGPVGWPVFLRPGCLAQRLWTRLSARSPSEQDLVALNAAMVLIADHELAASTLTARIAASSGADLCSSLLGALGVFSGSSNSPDLALLERIFSDAPAIENAAQLLDLTERGKGYLPGFSTAVYPGADPRARTLLAQLPPVPAVQAVLARAEVASHPPPDLDLALAALSASSQMLPGSAAAIFAIARTAGWIAHYLEERQDPHVFRARATYIGPLPGGAAAIEAPGPLR